MKLFLLIACAVACVAFGFVWGEPWLGGVGLVIGFVAMFTDRDDVRVDEEKSAHETTNSVRKMRSGPR